MKFEYVAQTKKGRKKSGIITAFNLKDAKKMLLEKDLILTSIKLIKVKSKSRFIFPILGKVFYVDKLLFVKHLRMMIKTGLPIREGVVEIKEQTKSRKFERILNNVVEHLDNGESLADSLEKHPVAFNEIFVSLIRAGEASGTLEESLGYLALQLEKSHDLRKKIKAAMLYPALVLGSTFTLVGVLAIFILPKLIPLFKSFGVELPLPTRILLWLIKAIQNYGLLIFTLAVFIFLFFVFISRFRAVKFINHTILLKLPITRKVSRNINLAYSARTLGTLIKSGIPIVEALNITANTLSSIVYQKHLRQSVSRVKRGEQIAVYFKTKPDLFPPVFSRMISVGEKTGRLDESLIYLAEFYEKEVDDITKNLSAILEPALLIIVGFLIGFIAVAIIMPIYEITHGLSGLRK